MMQDLGTLIYYLSIKKEETKRKESDARLRNGHSKLIRI